MEPVFFRFKHQNEEYLLPSIHKFKKLICQACVQPFLYFQATIAKLQINSSCTFFAHARIKGVTEEAWKGGRLEVFRDFDFNAAISLHVTWVQSMQARQSTKLYTLRRLKPHFSNLFCVDHTIGSLTRQVFCSSVYNWLLLNPFCRRLIIVSSGIDGNRSDDCSAP